MNYEGGCTITPDINNSVRENSQGQAESQRTWMHGVTGKEAIMDYLKALCSQEDAIYPPVKDHIGEMQSDADGSDIVWRKRLCEWCYEVVDHYKFDREVVSIALHYLDRAVAKWDTHSEVPIIKREYQLLAVASLYIAIKVHGETDCVDGPRRKLRIDTFFDLSRQQFDVNLIEATERHILSVLNWNVNPPTTIRFIDAYLQLCPQWNDGSAESPYNATVGHILDVARYLAELSVCQSSFSCLCKNSHVAYASILCAIESLHGTTPLPYDVRVAFLNSVAEATGLCSGDGEVLRICSMIKAMCPGQFDAVEDLASIVVAPSQDTDDDVSLDDRNASPVCVVDQPQGSTRKRGRADDWQPIDRQVSQ